MARDRGGIGGLVEVEVLLRVVGLGLLGIVLGHWRPDEMMKTRDTVDAGIL